jgi:hypothetical protein
MTNKLCYFCKQGRDPERPAAALVTGHIYDGDDKPVLRHVYVCEQCLEWDTLWVGDPHVDKWLTAEAAEPDDPPTPPAPVAPTSADGDAEAYILTDKEIDAIEADIEAYCDSDDTYFLHDFIHGDDVQMLIDAVRDARQKLDRLTAANAALQATVHNKEVALEAYRIERESNAPNGGETAADLPVYDTGIDAFNRGETAALVDTLKDARNALLSALAIPSELLPDVPHMGMKGMGFQIPPQPAPPATPRKLSSVKLTAAQVKVLKILDNHATYDFIPKFRFHGNGSTFKGLEKRGWITRNDEGLCHITPAGRAALASESEAGK